MEITKTKRAEPKVTFTTTDRSYYKKGRKVDRQHSKILRQGTEAWNKWREKNDNIRPDLCKADFSGDDLIEANLSEADLSEADLSEANLSGANLSRADLSEADLSGANLSGANLSVANLLEVNLSRADLSGADLCIADLTVANLIEVNLSGADLSGADLSGADLSGAKLIDTKLNKANLTECNIYGISAWNIELKDATQKNLVITKENEPTITIDNLEIAQFIYLLLNNSKIRDVIDTISKKAVLILGRFTPERKAILDTIRETLRKRDYLPILFDFDKPQSQDVTETITTLAHLAKFVIVDLTNPSSAPHEVMTIAPHCIVPIQPIFHPDDKTKYEYSMFRDLQRRYHWVLPTQHYQNLEDLLTLLQTNIIEPAEQKAKELEKKQ